MHTVCWRFCSCSSEKCRQPIHNGEQGFLPNSWSPNELGGMDEAGCSVASFPKSVFSTPQWSIISPISYLATVLKYMVVAYHVTVPEIANSTTPTVDLLCSHNVCEVMWIHRGSRGVVESWSSQLQNELMTRGRHKEVYLK